nr:phosphoribosylamine--glycine ligase [Modestobacter muralis]
MESDRWTTRSPGESPHPCEGDLSRRCDGRGERSAGRVIGTFCSVRVLVIGSGAREHALCVALQSDPAVTALACAPGNAGTAVIAAPFALDATDPVAVAALAVEWQADLVVVGPEVPLVAGAADAVRDAGIACFGPSAQAAQLEGSKAFAKHVMTAAGVPTARSWAVGGSGELHTVLAESGAPYVVKDDGLAAGKGVLVTTDHDAALAHGQAVLDAGHSVLVEEFLDGPEVSLFALTDGTTVVPLLPAQDAKRRDDGDGGPNTGGMGAYAPLPWAPAGLVAEVLVTVLQPTVDEMRRRGEPFSGLLYAGLALTSAGVRVVEFNARFGDPETQVVLPLLETPLAGLLHAAATGTLAEQPPLRWRDGAAVTVVVASEGYPERPRLGDPVTGADGEGVLHAGTAVGPDGLVHSAGGRVLSVTAVGEDLAAARQTVYERLASVRLAGAHWRTDIALAAVEGRITV